MAPKSRKPRTRAPQIPAIDEPRQKKDRSSRRRETELIEDSLNAGIDLADAIWDLIDLFSSK